MPDRTWVYLKHLDTHETIGVLVPMDEGDAESWGISHMRGDWDFVAVTPEMPPMMTLAMFEARERAALKGIAT